MLLSVGCGKADDLASSTGEAISDPLRAAALGAEVAWDDVPLESLLYARDALLVRVLGGSRSDDSAGWLPAACAELKTRGALVTRMADTCDGCGDASCDLATVGGFDTALLADGSSAADELLEAAAD